MPKFGAFGNNAAAMIVFDMSFSIHLHFSEYVPRNRVYVYSTLVDTVTEFSKAMQMYTPNGLI